MFAVVMKLVLAGAVQAVQFISPTGSLKLVRVFCSACISASASRKASVDSAPLILAQAIHVQAVAAAAGARVVEREAQIIAAEKPLKRAARFRNPEHVVRGMIRFDAGGDRGLRLDGLLVEQRAFLAAPDKIRSSRWAGKRRRRKSEL